MKRCFVFLSLVILAAASACYSSNKKGDENPSTNGFAVVELFTSEGCSSCPPADEALAKIVNEYKHNVYVLGFHVDYWNNYGWTDIFSNAEYTQRQKNYARTLKLPTIYTPQVVVNGVEQFVGSDKIKLRKAINDNLELPAPKMLEITALAEDDRKIQVSYKTTDTGNLNIALVQLKAENKIAAGENHGATLHHVNIVRDIKTISLETTEGTTVVTMPDGLSPGDCMIIAFAQNEDDLKITSAAEARIHDQ